MAIERFDVLIVGAGISGIGGGAHLVTECPDKSFAILEGRAKLGGTWDLFKYPGLRSDSDMYTLGFSFKPWTQDKGIAEAPAILDYLNEAADEFGLRRHIRFQHMLKEATWDSATALWTVGVDTPAGRKTMQARVLYMATGYYRYSEGYRPEFPGEERFTGPKIHPQNWPENLDYQGKRLLVIGSGATAVTIVPALVDRGALHVTMLQRSPSHYAIRPAKDGLANRMRKILPGRLAYSITRLKNVWIQKLFYEQSKKNPEMVAKFLRRAVRQELGSKYDPVHFTPSYGPWDQRVCLVPDGDMFKAIKRGAADIVTDEIESFTERGILTKSGTELEADIIVSATGLHSEMLHGVTVKVDGQVRTVGESYYYKGSMYGNIPNMFIVFGYSNASWTLKADLIAAYMCRLLKHLDQTRTDYAVPEPAGVQENSAGLANLSSGYVQRATGRLPKIGHAPPWCNHHHYRLDRKAMLKEKLEDGWLHFYRAGAVAPSEPAAEPAVATA